MYSNTKHIHTHTHTHTKLNLGNVFYARKMAPSSQGSVSIYLIKIQFKSQPSVLKIVYEEAAEGQTWERQREHHSPPAGTLLFFRETMWESEEEAEQAPPFSPWLWESEVSCRFHSTLGQIRNHSPVCKPPVLQGVGNLEQETTVTHTLTSLSLTPGLPGWGTERLQNREMVLPAQVCTKPHTPDDHRSEEGILHFKLFKRYSFFPGSSLSCPQYR